MPIATRRRSGVRRCSAAFRLSRGLPKRRSTAALQNLAGNSGLLCLAGSNLHEIRASLRRLLRFGTRVLCRPDGAGHPETDGFYKDAVLPGLADGSDDIPVVPRWHGGWWGIGGGVGRGGTHPSRFGGPAWGRGRRLSGGVFWPDLRFFPLPAPFPQTSGLFPHTPPLNPATPGLNPDIPGFNPAIGGRGSPYLGT